MVAEFWPHLAIIIYRLYPGRRGLSYRIFLATVIAEVIGTTFETAIVFWLWGSLWNQWTTPFKVVTPILYGLFSAAQLFGAWVFWQLAKKEKLSVDAEPSRRHGTHVDTQGESEESKPAAGKPKPATGVTETGV